MTSRTTIPQHLWEQSIDANAIEVGTRWAAGVVFEAFGEKCGVRTNNQRVLARIIEALPPVADLSDDPIVENLYTLTVAENKRTDNPGEHILYFNQTKIYAGQSLHTALEVLEDSMRLELAYWADDDFIFVHAGVVALNDRAIVFPGKSGAGKSTLVAKMLDAGAEYYSDDMAILDPSGAILPYPTAVSLRNDTEEIQRTRFRPSEQVGRRAIPIGLMLSSSYYPRIKRWQPRRLSPAEAVMTLFENTIAARRLPKQAIQRFNMALKTTHSFRGRRGEAETVVDWVFRQINHS